MRRIDSKTGKRKVNTVLLLIIFLLAPLGLGAVLLHGALKLLELLSGRLP